jgi:hypothetical protein
VASTQREEETGGEDSGQAKFLVTVQDFSTNGISFNGGEVLKGQTVSLIDNLPVVIDFGGSITLGLCFDKSQEQAFFDSRGSALSFSLNEAVERIGVNTEVHLKVAPIEKRARTSTKIKSNSKSSSDIPFESRKVSKPLVISVVVMIAVICLVIYNVVSGWF